MKDFNILRKVRTIWAVILFLLGKKPSFSTFVDEVSITAGYGQLDSCGVFRYELPMKYIRSMFDGCEKWNDYLLKHRETA